MSNIYANNINPRSGDTVTFPQNIKVLGTATYEDVANVDSVGIITAQSGINVTGGSVGIGLTNPEKLLEVSSNSSPTIRINNSDGSISADQTIGAIEFKANDGSGDGSQVTGSIESISQAAFTGQGSPSHLIFKTNGVSGANALAERLRITSGGNVNIGGEYSQTDSKVTIVDASRPIAEATLNLQSSTTSGAADTGPVLRFYGHSGSEGRYHASIKGAKENGTSGNTAGYLALNTRPAGGAMAERVRINSDGNFGIGTPSPRGKLEVSDGTSNTAGEAINEAYIVGATTGSSEGILTIQSNDAMASDKGGSIAFGGRAGTGSSGGANWAFINGYKENGTTANYGGYLSFATRPNSGTISEKMRIDSSGRMLIGTNSTTLHSPG